MTNHKTSLQILPVGVGSFKFFFESKKRESIENIILNLSNTLRNIPGISELKIQKDHWSPENIEKGKWELSFINIEFEIDLSVDPDSRNGADKYKFVTKNFYDVPVTLVISRTHTDEPSYAIYRIREYLKKFLKIPFSLDVIGPSPFHADFFLHLNSPKFSIKIEKMLGYDRIDLFVTKKNTRSISSEFLDKIGHELNLFYLIMEEGANKAENWNKIDKKISFITNNLSRKWYKRLIGWMFRNHFISNLMEDIITFEVASLNNEQVIRSREISTEIKFLNQYIKNEKENAYEYPLTTIKNLIEFKSAKRNQSITNWVTTLNTFISLGLSALITYLFYRIGVK